MYLTRKLETKDFQVLKWTSKPIYIMITFNSWRVWDNTVEIILLYRLDLSAPCMSVCPSQVGDSVLQLNFSQAILARILIIVHTVFFFCFFFFYFCFCFFFFFFLLLLFLCSICWKDIRWVSWWKRNKTWNHKKVEYWSWNHFYGQFLNTADSSRAVVSYWRNDVH